MCLSFKYPLIWGNPILLLPPLLWSWSLKTDGGGVCVWGLVHICAHMCFMDAMEAYLKKGRGSQAGSPSSSEALLLEQLKAAGVVRWMSLGFSLVYPKEQWLGSRLCCLDTD